MARSWPPLSVTSGITRPFSLVIVLRRLCSIREVMLLFLACVPLSSTPVLLLLRPVTDISLCRLLAVFTEPPISFKL